MTSIWISGSRGATMVLLIEGVILAGVLMWHRQRGASPRLLVVLLAVVIATAGVFSWLVSSGRVGGRAWSVFETNRSLEATLGDRFSVGVNTLHIVRSHPWLGVGVGCFESVFPKYLTFPMDRRWTHAHDDVLEVAAETGLPGVVLLIVAIALFVRMGFRRIEGRLNMGGVGFKLARPWAP